MEILPSGLPDQIAGEEDLTRFLPSSSLFNSLMAKPAAFMPETKDRETSVFRHGKEPIERLWEIGNQHVAKGRNIHGAAIFKASDVSAIQLELVADEPPDRHAVIRGWPWIENDLVLQKARQLELAARLASQAQLLRK